MKELLQQLKLLCQAQGTPAMGELLGQLEAQATRQTFLTGRLQKDLDRTVRYLNSTIEELEERNQELEEIADRRFRDVFENTLDSILLYNYVQGRIIATNPALMATFGYTDETFPWQEKLRLFPEYQADGQASAQIIPDNRAVVLEKRVANAFEVLCQRANGEVFEASAMIVPYSFDEEMLYLILRDISPQKKVEKALQEQKQELECYIESNMELENFAYIASHDLQAPIRGIVSFTTLFRRSLQGPLTGEQEEYLRYIETNALSMHELITALLTYSRVNTEENEFVTTDVAQLLRQLHQEFRPLLAERRANLEIGELPAPFYLDPIKVRQVFQNLLTNAIKFVPADRNPKISVSSYSDKTHHYFTVTDNGIGIAPEFQENIFLIFKRLHTQNEYKGTGIGLAICKKVIHQHQVRIWVTSTPGEGCTFTFSLAKHLMP
ncbi:MAG: ATP-binding protein [Bacteroidota bacterium]